MGTVIPLDEGGDNKFLHEEEVVTAIGKGANLFFSEQDLCKSCVEEVCTSNTCALKRELNAASEMKS